MSDKINMSVDIAGVTLKNPITVASGTFGSGMEYRGGENRENYSFASGKPSSFEVQWGQRTALIEISLWQ